MEQRARDEFEIREQCPVCRVSTIAPLIRHPFDQPPVSTYLKTHYGGRAELERLAGVCFEVDRCKQCGLIFQCTVPAGALLHDIYERWIPASERDRLHSKYTLSTYRAWISQVDFLVQHFGRPPREIDVFDFGLGWSEWASVARAFGCKVAGAELSQERVAYARSIGITVIDWDEIGQRQFHFINTEQVFEHLIRPRETLERLVTALRPEGLIKLSVPDGRGVGTALRRLPRLTAWPSDRLMPAAPLEHVNCFDYASLVELGRKVGLRPLRPRLRLLYNAASGWLTPREAARNILRPLYRHVYPKSTFVYFARDNRAA